MTGVAGTPVGTLDDAGTAGIAVAVPGLTGGVDEAARHLFGDRAVTGRWAPRLLVTRGQRPTLAPLVLVRSVMTLVGWRLTGRVRLLHLNMSSKGSAARKMVLATVARLIGLPYVIQVHGGGFAAFYDGLPGWARRPVRAVFRGARHVFVLGIPFRHLVEDTIGVDPVRVSILRNAVPLPTRSADERPDPGDGTPLVLFTGRLGAGKGVPELIEALGSVADLPWRAVLAGDGDVEGTRAAVTDLGLADRIDVRGWQSRQTVSGLLASADVFVLPSHLEALSVALLEAMADGVCCIATPVGAHGEVVTDEENGLLVEPGDQRALSEALRRALSDSALRQRLGRAARRTIEETCSTEVVADELSSVYEEILSWS